jgi:hypothetical protein
MKHKVGRDDRYWGWNRLVKPLHSVTAPNKGKVQVVFGAQTVVLVRQMPAEAGGLVLRVFS